MSYLGTDIASIHMINMCDLHFVPGGQIYALSKMPSIYMEIVLPQNLHWGPVEFFQIGLVLWKRPRIFIMANLSLRKPGSVLIIYPSLQIESFSI